MTHTGYLLEVKLPENRGLALRWVFVDPDAFETCGAFLETLGLPSRVARVQITELPENGDSPPCP